jgi:hypothetical protein
LLKNNIFKRIVKFLKKFADMRKKKRGNKYKNINKISKEEDKEDSFALNHIKKQD